MTDSSSKTLLVSSDSNLKNKLQLELEARGLSLFTSGTLQESFAIFENQALDTLVFDMVLYADDTLTILAAFREKWPMVPVVFLMEGTDLSPVPNLKGPFAIVHKTNIFGQFLDKLFDILLFFSGPGTPSAEEPVTDPVEEGLALFNQRLESLLTALKDLASSDRESKIYELILKELSNITDARGGSLFKFERGMLVLKYSIDPGHVPNSIALPLKPASPFNSAVSKGKPMLIKDIHGSKSLTHSGWKGYNDGSLMVIPLMDRDFNIISLISLHNKIHPPFNQRDLELARLFASLSSEIICSTLSEKTAREHHYHGLVTEAPIGLILFDFQGRILEVNPSFCQIVEQTARACLQSNIWKITPEKYHAGEQTLLRELASLNRPTLFEKDFITIRGNTVKVRLRYSHFNQKEKNVFLASVEPIT